MDEGGNKQLFRIHHLTMLRITTTELPTLSMAIDRDATLRAGDFNGLNAKRLSRSHFKQ